MKQELRVNLVILHHSLNLACVASLVFQELLVLRAISVALVTPVSVVKKVPLVCLELLASLGYKDLMVSRVTKVLKEHVVVMVEWDFRDVRVRQVLLA